MKKKRKINIQKIFSFISFIFILVCILWYGGRLIYFYQDSKKTISEESTTFARILKTENHDKDTFKQYNQTYYFYGNPSNNYVEYSNLIWRIVKINKDNSIVLISENILATLPYGENENDYQESNILKWLNQTDKENTGILEKNLNEKERMLVKTNVCTDKIENIEKITCEKTWQNNYIGLLSIEDYINTGGKNSFINNEKYNYLANKDKENNIWYINTEGKLDTTNGTDILGVKPIITLSPSLELKKGTGTIEDPYLLEEHKTLFASYVKLGEDIWRVYEEKEETLKLVSDNLLKETESNKEYLKYTYSKNNYYHNDTTYGSLAYYLNKTYLNSLDYKNIILNNTYVNGYYGTDNNFQYEDITTNTIETKISLPSLGDIILNDTLDNYFTNTGISANSSLIYIRKEKGTVTTKNVTTENYILPCISINKEILKEGSGSKNDPYRMEP